MLKFALKTIRGEDRATPSNAAKVKTDAKAAMLEQVDALEYDDLDQQARQDAQQAHKDRQEIVEQRISGREAALRRQLSSIIHLASTELDEYGRVNKRGFYRKYAAEKTNVIDAESPIMPPAKMKLYSEFLSQLILLDGLGVDDDRDVVEGKTASFHFDLFSA